MLGIGYLSALKNLGSKIEPHCIARTGAGHRERRTGDADIQTKFAGSGSIASGTALRKLIREKGIGAAADYLPEFFSACMAAAAFGLIISEISI